MKILRKPSIPMLSALAAGLLSALLAPVASEAASGADARIREQAYDAGRVVTVATKPGVTTLVQFAPDERVRSVAAGQGADCAQASDAWCVTWPANAGFVFVHPKTRAGLPLSLAVVTDRRAYSLVFEPLALLDPRVAVYRLSFTYAAQRRAGGGGSGDSGAGTSGPGELGAADAKAAPAVPVLAPVSQTDLMDERLKTQASQALPVNANYSIAYGRDSTELQPALAFDDGRFTYLQWPGNREIPAVFEIRADGTEMAANTRMQGELLVLDRIARGWMLRSGAAVAAIRNESFAPEGLAPIEGTTVPGVARTLKE